MEFDSDKIREQLRHYGELASSIAKMDTKELEGHVREFLQNKSHDLDTAALIDTLRTRTKKGLETVTDLVRSEFRQEFEDVAHKGRTEFTQFIEKVVCLIEDRFGTPRDHLEDEKAWRERHDAEKKALTDGEHSKGSEAKKSSAKKSMKSATKKDAKKSSSKSKADE